MSAGKTKIIFNFPQKDKEELLRDLGVNDAPGAAAVFDDVEAGSILDQQLETPAFPSGQYLPQEGKGQVVVVWSNKGGVGKTVLSCNLAVLLAKELQLKRRRVALLDWNFYNPDVCWHLDLSDQRRYAGAFLRDFNLDNLEQYMLPHPSLPNLHAMTGKGVRNGFEEARFGTPEKLEKLLREVKKLYQYIVIDTNPTIEAPGTHVALRMANQIFLVLEPELTSVLNNSRDTVAFLERLGINRDNIVVVMNRNFKTRITVDDVRRETGVHRVLQIPYDPKQIYNSIYNGRPVGLNAAGQNGIAHAVAAVAGEVVPGIKRKGKPTSYWIARVFGR